MSTTVSVVQAYIVRMSGMGAGPPIVAAELKTDWRKVKEEEAGFGSRSWATNQTKLPGKLWPHSPERQCSRVFFDRPRAAIASGSFDGGGCPGRMRNPPCFQAVSESE